MAKKIAITVPAHQVNKLGFRFRRGGTVPKVDPRLHVDGSEVTDPTVSVIPVRLPSIEQRLRIYEAAGAARQAYYDEVLELDSDGTPVDLYGDDFAYGDHLDDVPLHGLSPHEEHEIKDRANEARKVRQDVIEKARKKAATPPAAEAAEGPKAAAAASAAPPEGGK